jgi:hypothetical protein
MIYSEKCLIKKAKITLLLCLIYTNFHKNNKYYDNVRNQYS